MGTTELSAKPDEIMWGGGVGKLWRASILWNTPCHSQPTPPQDAGKSPEAVRFILVCEPTRTFFFSNKQKLAIYLLAIFVIWSLLLTHNSLFFLLQFFKFFLKKYAKNLSFFLFCLYSLKNAKEQWMKVHSNKAIPLTAIGAKSSSASCETKVKQEKRTQFTKFPNISFCNCQVKAKSDKRRHWSWFIHCAMWLI